MRKSLTKTTRKKSKIHEPVLVSEVLDLLKAEKFAHLKSQATFIDATLGNAGHSIEFVKRGINVLGIDADAEMIRFAKKRLRRVLRESSGSTILQGSSGPSAYPAAFSSHESGLIKIVFGNFKDIKRIAYKHGFESVEGILFDLGVSTHQLTSEIRGMSFADPDALLDMRLGSKKDLVMAKDILNLSSKEDLIGVFSEVCDFVYTRKLITEIVRRRKERSFEKVGDLLDVIKSLHAGKKSELHPATLPFLALRIKVNNELENLVDTLPQAFDLIVKGGRLAVISFHSGEDSIVKKYFKKIDMEGTGNIVTKKPIIPTGSEIKVNPRSRSAKLRVIEKSV